jgi:hypothetical protein
MSCRLRIWFQAQITRWCCSCFVESTSHMSIVIDRVNFNGQRYLTCRRQMNVHNRIGARQTWAYRCSILTRHYLDVCMCLWARLNQCVIEMLILVQFSYLNNVLKSIDIRVSVQKKERKRIGHANKIASHIDFVKLNEHFDCSSSETNGSMSNDKTAIVCPTCKISNTWYIQQENESDIIRWQAV